MLLLHEFAFEHVDRPTVGFPAWLLVTTLLYSWPFSLFETLTDASRLLKCWQAMLSPFNLKKCRMLKRRVA